MTVSSSARNAPSPSRSNSARTEQPARRSTVGVGVRERPSEAAGEQPPDRALAGAHEAGDGDRALESL